MYICIYGLEEGPPSGKPLPRILAHESFHKQGGLFQGRIETPIVKRGSGAGPATHKRSTTDPLVAYGFVDFVPFLYHFEAFWDRVYEFRRCVVDIGATYASRWAKTGFGVAVSRPGVRNGSPNGAQKR